VGNKIVRVDEKLIPPPRRHAEVIDATGHTLMPGLWDMHVHLQPNDGLLHLAAGVTSVRDMANDTDRLLAMRSRFDQDTEIGPRVLMAGFLDGRGPFAGPTKVFADSEQEAREAIDKYAKLGYVQIKIYSSIKPELVPKIAAMAHAHGMRVSGHVPAFMTAEQFVRDGVDEIQHMNFIFLNFMFDRVQDTRGPARFSEVAAHGAEVDPNSAQVKAFIQLLQEHKTVLDPTLTIFEDMFTARPGTASPSYAAVADRMPAQIRRGFFYGGLDVPAGLDQRYHDSLAQMLKMAKTFYDAGIPLVAGSDGLAGFTLHRELELYTQAGIPAPKVLQLATLGAARLMKRDQELGSIAPDKLADVVLVDGDPTANISDIRKVELVVKDGVLYKTADLYRAIGVQP
jgi:imidazolonepropionase-like amidohydrolase